MLSSVYLKDSDNFFLLNIQLNFFLTQVKFLFDSEFFPTALE